MAGQIWVTGSLGGQTYSPKLSKSFQIQAQQSCKFRQFTDAKDSLGRNAGDTYNWEKIANITTAGGTLVETSTMPEHEITFTKGTLTITEYGNAIPRSLKVYALTMIDLEDIIRRSLKNDMVKGIDTAVEAQFDACKLRYIGTATGGGVFSTNGTVIVGTTTYTNTSQFNKYHLQQMVDYLEGTAYAPPIFDSGEYGCIVSVPAARGLHDDLEAVWKYTKYAVNGEVGRYYNTRVIKATYSIAKTTGAAGTGGEAYVFGDDAVKEAVAIPERIVRKQQGSTDYGRSDGLGWYFLGGFKIMWEGDPDNRVIKFDSA